MTKDQEQMRLYFNALMLHVREVVRTEPLDTVATKTIREEWPSLTLELTWTLVQGMRARLEYQAARERQRQAEILARFDK